MMTEIPDMQERKQRLAASCLFHCGWYQSQLKTQSIHVEDPVVHYLEQGGTEGLDTHILFSSSHYCRQHSEIEQSHWTPLEHYLFVGDSKGYSPYPLFDNSFYRQQCDGEIPENLTALEHYILVGGAQGISPHILVDDQWYLDQYGDIGGEVSAPLYHYLLFGEDEGRRIHPFFDQHYYRKQIKRKRPENNSLIVDFWTNGQFETGISPHGWFDRSYYEQHYPEYKHSGLSSFGYFLKEGRYRLNNPSALFDMQWYQHEYAEIIGGTTDPFSHFLMNVSDRGTTFKTVDHDLFLKIEGEEILVVDRP